MTVTNHTSIVRLQTSVSFLFSPLHIYAKSVVISCPLVVFCLKYNDKSGQIKLNQSRQLVFHNFYSN